MVVNVTLERRNAGNITKHFVCIVVKQRPYNGELRYPNYLTYSYVDEIYNNCSWIESYLEISNPPIAPQANGNQSLPSDVKGILNQIEIHLDTIYNAIKDNTEDEYGYLSDAKQTYGTAYVWQGDVANPQDRVYRWKSFLDSVYSYLSPEDASNIVTETDANGDVSAVYIIDESGDVSSAYYID